MIGLGPIQTPDLRALLMSLKREIACELNCHQVGSIVSFDAASQTAQVQITMQRVVYNQEQGINAGLQTTPTIVNYPVLVDVPVFVHSGGGAVVTMPVAAGDSCLVLFNDRDIDNWFESGSAAAPNSPRVHSLSDGFALVGFRSKRNPVEDYSPDDWEVKYVGTKISIKKSTGHIFFESVDFGVIEVADKIGISNPSGSLRGALDSVITALTALNTLKTGGDASGSIATAAGKITALLK